MIGTRVCVLTAPWAGWLGPGSVAPRAVACPEASGLAQERLTGVGAWGACAQLQLATAAASASPWVSARTESSQETGCSSLRTQGPL